MEDEKFYYMKTQDIGDGEMRRHALNMRGEYIGTEADAKMLEAYGINPELIDGNNVCSIGFSARKKRWYGWSQRAFYGFGVGSKVSKGDCAYVGATPEDLIIARGEFFSGISEECAELHRQECQALADGSGIRILHAPLIIPMAKTVEELEASIAGELELEPADINKDAVSIVKCGRGEWTAETLDDARQMACDFAKGVS